MSVSPFQQQIRTVLVDDEDIALYNLQKALKAHASVRIMDVAKDGKSAVEMINRLRPDLVFLDIQMPEWNGFEVLNRLEYMPMIVFVTAYESYAVKAFEENSLDYLLKPLEDQRLALTMKRVTERLADKEDILLKIQSLVSGQQRVDTISTLPVKVGTSIHLVHVQDICFFEAKDKYVYIHTAQEERLTDFSLAYLQDRLPPEFIRVHRSFIINKLKIAEIQKYFKGTYLLVMNDLKRSKIKSSYSYYDLIKTRLLLP
jgi:two-component system LytT family response regulator